MRVDLSFAKWNVLSNPVVKYISSSKYMVL